jgi:hypothetical protein
VLWAGRQDACGGSMWHQSHLLPEGPGTVWQNVGVLGGPWKRQGDSGCQRTGQASQAEAKLQCCVPRHPEPLSIREDGVGTRNQAVAGCVRVCQPEKAVFAEGLLSFPFLGFEFRASHLLSATSASLVARITNSHHHTQLTG